MLNRLLALLPFSFIILALGVNAQDRDPNNTLDDPLLPINKLYALLPIKDEQYGERNVSYFVTEDGDAVIDGDVIYGTVEELRSKDITRSGNTANKARAFSIFSPAQAWPSATVTFKYDSAATETLLKPIVDAAIARWRITAPYLTFTKTLNSAIGVPGVLTIKAPPCGGCNAHVGFANSPRTMNLQQSCPSAPGVCGVSEATHEFGHVLGLIHEHQRPDRESTVHFNCANLAPSCPPGTIFPFGKTCCNSGLPSGCCTNSAQFAIDSGPFDTAGGYDVDSIMQYRANAFALPGTLTLTPVAAGISIPSSNPPNPDARDFDRICKIYSKQCPKAISCAKSGCPTHCLIIKMCNNPILCSTDFAPVCCEPSSENEQCTAQKKICAGMPQCNFLN